MVKSKEFDQPNVYVMESQKYRQGPPIMQAQPMYAPSPMQNAPPGYQQQGYHPGYNQQGYNQPDAGYNNMGDYSNGYRQQPLYNQPPTNYNYYYKNPSERRSTSSSSRRVPALYPTKQGEFPSGQLLSPDTSITIRHAFVRKVFSLVGVNLFLTFCLVGAAAFIPAFKEFLQRNYWIGLVSSILSMGVLLALVCSKRLSEKSPLNVILFFIVGVLMGLSLSVITGFYDVKVLGLASGTTFAVVLACTLFACQTKYDFTKWYPYVMVAFLVLMMMGIIGWFVLNDVFQIIYGVFGVLLFSFLLILDTQMIVGGKRSQQFTIDQAVPAALTVYMDIINIFMYMLRIFGAAED